MQWPKTLLEWTLWVGSAIVLAVAGNAAWEYVVRPLFAALFRGIAKWTRHRSSRMFDALFAIAATRPREVYSRILILVLIFTSVGFAGMTGSELQHSLSERREQHAAELEEASKFPPKEALSKLEALREKSETRLIALKKKFAIAQAVIVFGGLIFVVVAFLRALTIDFITRMFEQKLAVVRPQLSERESLELLKGFAEMKKWDDFRQLMKRMGESPPA